MLMAVTTRASLRSTRSAVLVTTIGRMARPTLGIGARIRWMVRASSSGKTARYTQASSSMTSARDMARSSGPTVVSISVSGRLESNTESVLTSARKASRSKESGKQVAKSGGSPKLMGRRRLETMPATMMTERRSLSN